MEHDGTMNLAANLRRDYARMIKNDEKEENKKNSLAVQSSNPAWHKHVGKVEVGVVESAEEPNERSKANDVRHDG